MPDNDEDIIIDVADSGVGPLTKSEVRRYIESSLGEQTFKVELSEEQLDNSIKLAIQKFSKRKPMVGFKELKTNPAIKAYSIDHSIGYGIFDVQFVSLVKPSAIYQMGLLGGVVPIKPRFISDLAEFLTWRETFQRVASTKPMWDYDKIYQKLMIYSPVSYEVCYFWYAPHRLSTIPMQHHDWILDYSLANAKKILGHVRSKYSGVLPGPARDLNLNGESLLSEAKEEMDALETKLFEMQADRPPKFT